MSLAVPDLFLCDEPALRELLRRALRTMPDLQGKPIRISTASGLRDHRGPVHAGAFLRERKIVFDCARQEFPRILVHEMFHFVWLRLGNPGRRSFEDVLRGECVQRARGELGWSSEWRKLKLGSRDWEARTRRWREYCCESFCDSAAWLYSGVTRHSEYTLAAARRERRRAWFDEKLGGGCLPI